MKRSIAFFLAGLVLGSASIGIAASMRTHGSQIVLHDGDNVVMPELHWECYYFTNVVAVFTKTPRGPALHCGKLGTPTGGIRTGTDLYYVFVRRGTNQKPRILFKGRRP